MEGREALARSMKLQFPITSLPQLYTGGMVSAALVKRIAAIRGAFFQSYNPDIYSNFAICSKIDKFLYLREPFAISGASKHSNGYHAKAAKLKRPIFYDEGNIKYHHDTVVEDDAIIISGHFYLYESYLQSKFIHNDFMNLSHAEQLQLILNDINSYGVMPDGWSKRFANYHGIDHDVAVKKSRKMPLRRRVSLMGMDFINIAERFRIDSSYGLAINDVFEASLVAATVLATRPSRVDNFTRVIRRIATRTFRQGLAVSKVSTRTG